MQAAQQGTECQQPRDRGTSVLAVIMCLMFTITLGVLLSLSIEDVGQSLSEELFAGMNESHHADRGPAKQPAAIRGPMKQPVVDAGLHPAGTSSKTLIHKAPRDKVEPKSRSGKVAGNKTKSRPITATNKQIATMKKKPKSKPSKIELSTADPQLAKKASVADGKMRKIELDPSRYPTARCNDGSQGGFYYSPPTRSSAQVPASEDYVVMLEGGGWCSSAESCKNRQRDKRMSSTLTDAPTIEGHGVLDPRSKRNPFLSAHKVYLRYCSSDGFSGNRDASDPVATGLHFRGAVIVEATVRELVRTFNLTGADRLFLGGFSAGARGAMFNLDVVERYLPAGARVVGLLDSPFWLDMEPFELSRTCKGVLTMANASGVLGDRCAAAFPKAERWKCLLGQYRLHYVSRPFVVAAAQYDGFQLGTNKGHMAWKHRDNKDLWREEKAQYEESFAAKTREELRTLPASNCLIFSTTCHNHVTAGGDNLWRIRIENGTGTRAWTLADMFAMARREQFGEVVISDCNGRKGCNGCRK